MKLARSAGWFVCATILLGCGDAATSPRSDARSLDAASINGGSTADLIPGDTLRFSININPYQSATYDLGNGHTVYFPAGSVCDPSRSTYGVGTWDTPCAWLGYSLVEHVKAWIDSTGNPYEDFSPSIRFMPTSNPSKYVILSLTDPQAASNLSMNIVWCATTWSPCVNEALLDPTEVTQHDPVTGKVWRRIKHFSGYNVAAGDLSDPSSMQILSTGHGVNAGQSAVQAQRTRSGFMLASGRSGQ